MLREGESGRREGESVEKVESRRRENLESPVDRRRKDAGDFLTVYQGLATTMRHGVSKEAAPPAETQLCTVPRPFGEHSTLDDEHVRALPYCCPYLVRHRLHLERVQLIQQRRRRILEFGARETGGDEVLDDVGEVVSRSDAGGVLELLCNARRCFLEEGGEGRVKLMGAEKRRHELIGFELW